MRYWFVLIISVAVPTVYATDYGGLATTDYGVLASSADYGDVADDRVFTGFGSSLGKPKTQPQQALFVRMYSTKSCPYCVTSKAWLERRGVRVIVDYNVPQWVRAVPTFHWENAQGKGKSHTGALDDHVGKWLIKQLTAAQRKPQAVELDPNVPADAQPTPYDAVYSTLALLKPKPDEVFVDYGCGYDARFCVVAAAIYGCDAIGVELNPERAVSARERVAALGLQHKVQIIEGDATEVNITADVGVVYLWPATLQALKSKLQQLDRFASYQHQVPGLQMTLHDDVYIWDSAQHTQSTYTAAKYTQPSGNYAVYNGVRYTGRVCNNRGCSMCAAIESQLRQNRRGRLFNLFN